MKLHTLGPIGTDSQLAAQYYVTHEELVLHQSFEDILTHLDDYVGEQLIMPVAFKSNQVQDLNWADMNYLEWARLDIISTFSLPLMPMSLIENVAYQRNIAIIHAATEGLLRQYLRTNHLDNAWGPSIIFSPSKPVAMSDFINDQNRFTIVSEKQFLKLPESENPNYHIRQQLAPQMIWVVYQIK
ncbi:hypothetical protein [Leuconostoc rapi]|uniref:hypothetical protein n=1 Tax=Leuconostoc rapi TaxID=1406906 RepID=UPI00195C6AC7|nr:hypothetical protein [Leuconostoc rapi]MBM7435791.1 hypothetical protein [Leuconostoc rapi]